LFLLGRGEWKKRWVKKGKGTKKAIGEVLVSGVLRTLSETKKIWRVVATCVFTLRRSDSTC
jgi:sirohydrochlorin ferrochelatase